MIGRLPSVRPQSAVCPPDVRWFSAICPLAISHPSARRPGASHPPSIRLLSIVCRPAIRRPLCAVRQPGDILAFHFRTVHDAAGNELPSRRRAVSLRWLGDDARFATRPWPVSPPYRPDGLSPGDPPGDDPRFPLAFP